MIAKAAAEIAQTPAASPSTPSVKLTAFMIADEADQRERAAEPAEVDAADERQREVVDLDAAEHEDQRRDRTGPASLTAGGSSRASSTRRRA